MIGSVCKTWLMYWNHLRVIFITFKLLTSCIVATLEASKGGISLGITNVIPAYQYCADKLLELKDKFDEKEDIYIAMTGAYEKLIHYYDNVSPIVGIALWTFKMGALKDFGWESDWIETATNSFKDAFAAYSLKYGVERQSCNFTAKANVTDADNDFRKQETETWEYYQWSD